VSAPARNSYGKSGNPIWDTKDDELCKLRAQKPPVPYKECARLLGVTVGQISGHVRMLKERADPSARKNRRKRARPAEKRERLDDGTLPPWTAPPPIEVAEMRRLTYAELSDEACAYDIGGGKFCGRDNEKGKAFCPEHCAIVYQR
jgi:hypothetical protein